MKSIDKPTYFCRREDFLLFAISTAARQKTRYAMAQHISASFWRCFFFAKFLILCGVVIIAPLSAQISYHTPQNVHFETFDSLPTSTNNTTTFTWTDNLTLPGWFASSSLANGLPSAGITTGSTTTARLYSFGASGSAERALGSIGSSSTGDLYWGICLVNNTGSIITSFTVAYTGEQWRNSAQGVQSLSIGYSLTSSGLKNGEYISIPSLSFASPISGGTVGALDGHATANRVQIGAATINNIVWKPGAQLWIRFSDIDHPSNDHGLAIDNFSFSAGGNNLGAPVGYYDSAQGLTGEELLSALNGIISNHTIIPYDSSSGATDVKAALSMLDEDSFDSTKIHLLYTDTSVLKTSTTWNREHLWPGSRGIGSNGADYSDLFAIRPSLASINSARGAKFFDNSDPSNSNYRSPAAVGAASGTSADTDSWQPLASEKGDIARALLYMDVRYDGTDLNTTDLFLEDGIFNSTDMAMLTTLLEWSNTDPVSNEEILRNAMIYSHYQHNRNPFVDHPEYVNLVFGAIVRKATDIDFDGMPSYWEVVRGLDGDSPLDANQDLDFDGLSNAEEYWIGSDPHDGADPIQVLVDKSYSGSTEDGTSAYPFKTIQGAVNSITTSSLRVIMVKPGLYPENVEIAGKPKVFLYSTEGASVTKIEGQTGSGLPIVTISGFNRSSLCGFSIKNGNSTLSGAGVKIDSSNGLIQISENFIANNISSSASGGGGLDITAHSNSKITNNIIVLNQATTGGGVLFRGGNVSFWHNTVALNTATQGTGGGLAAATSIIPSIEANIIWENMGIGNSAQISNISSLINNILQDAQSGSGNLAVDPLFVSSINGDFHIQALSPARNAANPLSVSIDYDHNSRPENYGEAKDIGADEFYSGTSDSDNDQMPDAWELANFPSLNEGRSDDYDNDGVLNYMDAKPANPEIGLMSVQITSPVNGATVL